MSEEITPETTFEVQWDAYEHPDLVVWTNAGNHFIPASRKALIALAHDILREAQEDHKGKAPALRDAEAAVHAQCCPIFKMVSEMRAEIRAELRTIRKHAAEVFGWQSAPLDLSAQPPKHQREDQNDEHTQH